MFGFRGQIGKVLDSKTLYILLGAVSLFFFAAHAVLSK